MIPAMRLVIAAMLCAAVGGCGSAAKTTTATTSSAGQYSARQESVKRQVEQTITNQINQNQASTDAQVGNVNPLADVQSTTCIALSDTQLTCTITLGNGEQQTWTAAVDQDTGQVQAQQQS